LLDGEEAGQLSFGLSQTLKLESPGSVSRFPWEWLVQAEVDFFVS
jgi:hypothetical protein